MERLNRNLPLVKFEKKMPEKVIMFGEGEFLRAFACLAFDVLNEKKLFNGSVTIVQPTPEGKIDLIRQQDGLYTVIERGLENGEKRINTRLITCVEDCINPYEDYENYIHKARNPELRYIVSDTTETGFSCCEGELLSDKPQVSFPGKVTAFLYERFKFFEGDDKKGLVFLPCEPIENNGDKLKKITEKYAAQWKLEKEFTEWINEYCVFANTLTDRIVTGYPREEAEKIFEESGYRDELLNTCELFYFWAIESARFAGHIKQELPFDKAGLNVIFSDDISLHRLKKARMFNGAHICLAPAALLTGYTTVAEAVGDPMFKKYLEKVLYNEIIPTLDMNRNVLEGFAKSVITRFSNPFTGHELQEITHDCISKFKARIFPAIFEYQRRFGKIPPILTFSFAAMIAFYKNGGHIKIADDEKSTAFLRDNDLDVIFKNIGFWEVDLLENEELCTAVEEALRRIKLGGIKNEIMRLSENN